MNRVLAELTTLPLYGQIVVQDVGTGDLPEWETGEEHMLASEHAVVIATRSDADGDVTIRVIEGDDSGGLGELVFDGELSLTSPALEIGSPLAGKVDHVDVGRVGFIPLRIFVYPSADPDHVHVLLGATRVGLNA